jgi:1-aminocyclopropane-1-carboxylate deaminase/D-cysteine desulfhydrase-like pyridoxal-dependent ACC family enzyme
VDPLKVAGRAFFVKRDDLVDPRFSGNKFRKLYTLFQLPAKRYNKVVSYGGAQSNTMLSIAHLARLKGWRFHYYCKALPAWLRAAPAGNLREALKQGMILHEIPHARFAEQIAALRETADSRTLVIPQGGADRVAREGVRVLAEEIMAWIAAEGLKRVTVVTPSGTGTTALYLRRYLPPDMAVMTEPVVIAEAPAIQQHKLPPF